MPEPLIRLQANQERRSLEGRLHRHAVCKSFAVGRDVLVLACGAGNGAALIATAPARVTAVDGDADVLRKARERHASDNLRFVTASILDLPFEPASFDLVIADDIFRRTDDRGTLFGETKRLLRGGGMLLLSMPHRLTEDSRAGSVVPWPAQDGHIAFERELRTHFEHVALLGQRTAVMSAVYPLDEAAWTRNAPGARIYETSILTPDRVDEVPLMLAHPEHLLAICSDVPLDLSNLSASLLHSRDSDGGAAYELATERLAETTQQVGRLEAELQAVLKNAAMQRAELQAARDEAAFARQEADEARRSAMMSAPLQDAATRLLGRMAGVTVNGTTEGQVEALFALHERMVQQDLRHRALDAELTRLREADVRLNDLQARLSAAEAEAAIARSQATERSQAQELLKEEHRHLRSLYSESASALRESELHAAELGAIETVQRGRLATVEQERARIAATLEQVRQAQATLSVELEAERASAEALRARLSTIEQERAMLFDAHRLAQEDLGAAARQLDAERSAATALRAELDASNLRAAKLQAAAERSDAERADALRLELERRQRLEAELESARATTASVQNELLTLQGSVHTLEAEKASEAAAARMGRDAVAELEAKLTSLTVEKREHQKRIDDLMSAAEAASAQRESLEQELDRVHHEATAARARHEDQDGRVTRLANELDEERRRAADAATREKELRERFSSIMARMQKEAAASAADRRALMQRAEEAERLEAEARASLISQSTRAEALAQQLRGAQLEAARAEALLRDNAAAGSGRDGDKAAEQELEAGRKSGGGAAAQSSVDDAAAVTDGKAASSRAEHARLRPAMTQLPLAQRPPARPATPGPATFASGAAAPSPRGMGADRRRDRVLQLRRRVADQVGAATAEVSGRVPAFTPVRPRLSTRLLRRRKPPRTVLFDADWIARRHPQHAGLTLRVYLADEALRTVDPHPLFAAARYLERYQDVASAGVSPLLHYIEHGWREGRDPHPWFANDWYLARNPDVLAAGTISPLEHYLRFGWREGRWPNPVFDPGAYLRAHADVAAADVEPLTHYAAFGRAEGRTLPVPGLQGEWQDLVDPSGSIDNPLDLLLTPAPLRQVADGQIGQDASTDNGWPPCSIGGVSLPQQLRDHFIETSGDEPIDLFAFFYSVMAAYKDAPDDFARSAACRQLLERAARRARERAGSGAVPDATVIVPVYNNLLDTLLCVASILELETDRCFEVIVADDGSTDETPRVVGAIGGVVKHLRQPRNLGFLGNCNAAAAQARGRVVVLLNNDTLVLPGWLDGLLSPFDRFDHVGLVGSKLLNWDGTLQEAGGIFWNDGSAWNFGRGQNPRAPQFCYLKDVDYVSGASIAVPVDVWRQVGGFDPLFSPAYCEDSDLAFRLRAGGWRTLMNPASQVIHHEGRSHGRDLSSGGKAYQVANQQRLLERWRDVLARDHFPNGQSVLYARDSSGRKPHVLIIDHYVPEWDKDAGSRTMLRFLETLVARGWSVSFWPDNLNRDPRYAPAIEELGVEVFHGPQFVGQFEAMLRDRADLYDAVLLSRPHVARTYLDAVRRLTRARVVYYGHDLHFARMAMQLEQGDPAVAAADVEAMRETEAQVWRASDVVLYPSREEVAAVRTAIPQAQAFEVPAYSFDPETLARATARLVQPAQPADDAFSMLFVGGFRHTPNVDGIRWFVHDVVPRLRAAGKRFHLNIVGANPPIDVLRLAGPDIAVLGFVADDRLVQLYASADMVVAPLRYGAGVKGKVVEAMAHGVPVVTTPVGAQGLDDASSMLFVAADAEGLARAIIEAAHPAHARLKASAALEHVQRRFSGQALGDALQHALSLTKCPAQAH